MTATEAKPLPLAGMRPSTPAQEVGGNPAPDLRFLLLVSVLSAALLLFRLGAQNLWLDEVMSAQVAAGSWPDTWRFFQGLPEQHPLYYLLLRAWHLLGDSDAALRSFSALFSVLSLWVLYPLVRELESERVARISCLLLASSPFYLFYGQEARMYSLLGFLAILGTLALLRFLRAPSGPALASYTVVGILGAYTHLYFLFLLAAHFAYLVARYRSDRHRLRGVLAAQLVVGLSYLPWVWLILTHLTSGQWWKGPAHLVFGVPYTLLRFVLGYSEFVANRGWKERVPELLAANFFLVAVAALCAGALALAGARRLRRGSPAGLLVMLSLAVPFGVALLVSLVTMVIGERYFIVSYPFFVILLAAGIASAWEWTGRAALLGRGLVLGHAAVLLLCLYAYYFGSEFGKEQWSEVAQVLTTVGTPSDVIVLRSGYIEGALRRYYAVPARQRVVKSERLVAGDLAGSGRVWLVLAHAPDADAFAEQLIRSHAVEREWVFPHQSGIRLLLLEPRGHVANPS